MCEHIFLQHLSANLMIFGCLNPPENPISKTYLTPWATLYPYAPGKYMLTHRLLLTTNPGIYAHPKFMLTTYPDIYAQSIPQFMLTTPQIYAHRKPYMLNEQILMLATTPTVMLTQKQCMLRLPSVRYVLMPHARAKHAHVHVRMRAHTHVHVHMRVHVHVHMCQRVHVCMHACACVSACAHMSARWLGISRPHTAPHG